MTDTSGPEQRVTRYDYTDATRLRNAETAAYRAAVESGADETQVVQAVHAARAQHAAAKLGTSVAGAVDAFNGLAASVAQTSEALTRLARRTGTVTTLDDYRDQEGTRRG